MSKKQMTAGEAAKILRREVSTITAAEIEAASLPVSVRSNVRQVESDGDGTNLSVAQFNDLHERRIIDEYGSFTSYGGQIAQALAGR